MGWMAGRKLRLLRGRSVVGGWGVGNVSLHEANLATEIQFFSDDVVCWLSEFPWGSEEIMLFNRFSWGGGDLQCITSEFTSTCPSGRVTQKLTCPNENQLAQIIFPLIFIS